MTHDDLKKIYEKWNLKTSDWEYGVNEGDALDFAQQVIAAVLKEVARRMKPDNLMMTHGVNTPVLWPAELKKLKRDLCGPEQEEKRP